MCFRKGKKAAARCVWNHLADGFFSFLCILIVTVSDRGMRKIIQRNLITADASSSKIHYLKLAVYIGSALRGKRREKSWQVSPHPHSHPRSQWLLHALWNANLWIINKKAKINKHGKNKWILTSIICISFILLRLGDVRRSMQRFHYCFARNAFRCVAIA